MVDRRGGRPPETGGAAHIRVVRLRWAEDGTSARASEEVALPVVVTLILVAVAGRETFPRAEAQTGVPLPELDG